MRSADRNKRKNLKADMRRPADRTATSVSINGSNKAGRPTRAVVMTSTVNRVVTAPMLDGAKDFCADLLDQRGHLLPAAHLVQKLKSLSWCPGGGSAAQNRMRRRAIKRLYALEVLLTNVPNERQKLQLLLCKKLKLKAGTNALVRAVICDPPNEKRAEAFYSERSCIIEALFRHKVKPTAVGKFMVQKKLSVENLIKQGQQFRRARPSKYTRPSLPKGSSSSAQGKPLYR